MNEMKTVSLTVDLYRYALEHMPPLGPVQQDLIERTAGLGEVAEMQIPPEQGALLTMLAQLVGAHHIVEVGTFTGYATLALALGLGPGGVVITCDISEEWTEIARSAWLKAGVADRIVLRLGPADQTLSSMPDEPHIDLAFIDADKPGYIRYWELLVPRMRPGGLIIVDNTFYKGEVINRDAVGKPGAIRACNAHIRADDRVDAVMLPIADGVILARRKDNVSSEYSR